MTLASLLARLKNEGTIEQVRVNRYKVNPTVRQQVLDVDTTRLYTRPQIFELFCMPDDHGGYRFRVQLSIRNTGIFNYGGGPTAPTPRVERRRTITRNSYHSSGQGVFRSGVDSALSAIPFDSDGVRRSYGLEYEIYALNDEQEDKLARLLDTLPAHTTERDGSLSGSGVEIVFLPLGEHQLKDTWAKLTAFVQENRVDMQRTGAHITYGVSNAHTSVSDLQIRLNRVALAVKAVSSQGSIKRVFGRDFTHMGMTPNYCQLPCSTTFSAHSNAFNAARGDSAYECRLCNWRGDIDKIVEFMKKTEFVFTRPFAGPDLVNIYTLMGSNAQGE